MTEEVKVNHPKKTLLRLWSYLKKHRFKMIIVTIMIIIMTLTSVLGPLLMSYILDDFIGSGKIEGFIWIILLLGFIYFINSLFDFLANFIMVKVSEDTLYNIRKDLFNHMENLSLNFFDTNKKGDLMSRFTNDITIISNALSEAAIQIISSTITLIGVTIIMFAFNPTLAITTIVPVPLLFVLALLIGKKAGNYFLDQQNNLGKLNSYAEETITGMKVVKSYVKEKEVLLDFDKYNDDLKKSVVKAQLYANLIMPANLIVTNIGNILLIAVGSFMIINGNTTIGGLLAFLTYASMFRQPINQLASLFASVNEGLAGAERVFEVIDTEIDIKEKTEAINLERINGNVVLENVTFGYTDDKVVLKNINLEVKKGQTIAIVVKTGAGKTTIANLLPRFYDVNSGTIKIDGIDIKDVTLKSLRQKIDIVLQDTYLFKGTIKDNISYGKMNATIDEVKKASQKACAHSFIRRLPNGYDSLVLEEGSNLSQGERQLISIARAILADPDILILDEATSNIDTKTELEINRGMKELLKGRTSFVIAHRLSTIRDADEIVVIDSGKIVERGNHHELLQKKGYYYKLYKGQFE